MTRLLSILILLCAVGCVNVERLAKQLSAEKGVFFVEHKNWCGKTRVGLANPILGVSGSVLTNGGLTLTVPPGMQMSVNYVQHLAPTNSPKAQP